MDKMKKKQKKQKDSAVILLDLVAEYVLKKSWMGSTDPQTWYEQEQELKDIEKELITRYGKTRGDKLIKELKGWS